jgi:uncharacterized membrane protein YfhO
LNGQLFEITLDLPSWVVFSEVNYPGWKAWVDNNPCRIQTSNYLFCGLFIPAGKHSVRFSFEPAWFRFLAFAGLLWLVTTTVLGGILKPSKR